MLTPTTPIHSCAAPVQLIERHGEVPPGARGHIVGRFARENPTYLVSFDVEGLIEVRGDEIVGSAA
jgi:hypothetical protein